MIRFLFTCAVAMAASFAIAAEPLPNKALNALFEREFQLGLVESPENSTFLGIDTFNDRLSDFSPEATARRRAHNKIVIAELGEFDPKKLSTQDRISREMMQDGLVRSEDENRIYGDLPFGADGNDEWLVVTTQQGPQFTYPLLAKVTPFRHVRDYDNYLKRLEALPRALSQLTTRMEAGIKSGWMPPREAMERAPGQFDAFGAADITKTPLFAPFKGEEARTLAKGGAFKLHEANPGAEIIKQGKTPDFLYVVLAGRVAIYLATQPGRPRAVAILGPGEILGEMSMISGGPATATVKALKRVWLLAMPRDVFQTRVLTHQGVREYVRGLAEARRLANQSAPSGDSPSHPAPTGTTPQSSRLPIV